MIETAWPGVEVYAADAGMINPYNPGNADKFRGEEAFAPEVTGRRRWSKPSPEPVINDEFRSLLLNTIQRQAGIVSALIERIAERIVSYSAKPPLLVAILRAGLPVAVLLARRLESRSAGSVPVAALSLFHGLGWDDAALYEVLKRHPDRTVWFVDGWTGGGGVAEELQASYRRWRSGGGRAFCDDAGPRLAVLCDPNGYAHLCGRRHDIFVSSSCFTAPETLGFSRGFVGAAGEMFKVYRFERDLIQIQCIESWLAIADAPPSRLADDVNRQYPPLPNGWRLYSNEVARALINRNPTEVFFRDSEAVALRDLRPLLSLCVQRGAPVTYECGELARWGAQVAARMNGRPYGQPPQSDS